MGTYRDEQSITNYMKCATGYWKRKEELERISIMTRQNNGQIF
jgi:hypothetical protein